MLLNAYAFCILDYNNYSESYKSLVRMENFLITSYTITLYSRLFWTLTIHAFILYLQLSMGFKKAGTEADHSILATPRGDHR